MFNSIQTNNESQFVEDVENLAKEISKLEAPAPEEETPSDSEESTE
jgi:hypothetical protein